jgi:bifunctional non-homologous end joining protein LigD
VRNKKTRRFVIQRHKRQDEPVHWDLMLERDDFLETYRIGIAPEQWGSGPIEAVKIFDHPLKFLTYEGSVNKGKGRVSIADSGTYEILTYNEDKMVIKFSGRFVNKEIIFAIGGGRARRG